MPNSGDAIIIIDKAMANAPAVVLNTLEPVLAVVFLPFFSSLFTPLRPAIMLEMPLNSNAMGQQYSKCWQKQEDTP